MKTSSSIGASRPVNVFCWLRWKQPSSVYGPTRGLRAVAEARPRLRDRGRARADAQHAVPRERAERDDHRDVAAAARARARGTAGTVALRGVGLLPGGAQRTIAATYASRQHEAVVAAADVGWFAKPRAVQRGEQPVAGAVAGEDAAGAIAAVRRRREPDDQRRARPDRRTPAPGAPSRPGRRSARPRSRATSRATRRAAGQARHATTSRRPGRSPAAVMRGAGTGLNRDPRNDALVRGEPRCWC